MVELTTGDQHIFSVSAVPDQKVPLVGDSWCVPGAKQGQEWQEFTHGVG